jgi:hypothetical protein
LKATLVLLVLAAAALLPTTAAAATPSVEAADGCYMVYTRYDVGQLTVIRRTSCSPPEPYWCPYPGAPLRDCDGLLGAAA